MKTNVNKYPNGYWNMIKYWNFELNEAITNGDLRGVDSAHNKMNYFIGKQWDLEYTQVTDNVMGYLSEADVTDTLEKMQKL